MNQPNAASDLATYRSNYGLPACTVANGCFRQVNQSGATSPLPANDSGWGEEIDLDIDMASAICPQCHILLVEATSASNANLGISVNTAVSLGANVVSNSYGGGESSSDPSTTAAYYNHPGVLITASSGDGSESAALIASVAVRCPLAGAAIRCPGKAGLVQRTAGPRKEPSRSRPRYATRRGRLPDLAPI